MNDPSDFTVLAPIWAGDNPAHFDTAMRSVAHSSLAPREIVICQDGDLPAPLHTALTRSADAVGARIIRNPGPRGLGHNLNHAITTVRTAWVARVDADDINLAGRFAAQVRFLRENPDVAVVGGRIVEFSPDGRRRGKTMPLDHGAIVRRARWRNPINHMTAFFNLEAVRTCGGYPNIPYKEDYALWLKMIGRGFRLANLDQDLVDARLGDDFHRRRGGLHNLSSEYALFALKRSNAVLRPEATRAWLARSAALSFVAPARLLYLGVLRR